jgi:DNA-directed RNA polymerase subunit H (RpoH/RPB5)
MTGEPEKREATIAHPLENNKHHIVNSRDLPINQRTGEDRIFIPYKTAIDERTGKEVTSSWIEVGAEKVVKKPDKLEALEEERLNKDPRYFEFVKTKYLSNHDESKYKEKRMHVLENERLKNNGLPMPITNDMVNKALNMSDGELEELKRENKNLKEALKQVVKMPKIKPSERGNYNAGIISEYLDKKDDEREEEAREEKKRREAENLKQKPQIS